MNTQDIVSQEVSQEAPKEFAVIRTSGKQFVVSPGQRLVIDQLSEVATGDEVEFSEVLMTKSDKGTQVGAPLVAGATVKAKLLSHGRSKKVIAFKKKRRQGYTKTQGHRQDQSTLVIQSISA